jgi:hypothetical protein
MNSKKVILSGGVALLLVGALAGYLYGVNSAPKTTTTVSTISDAYDQVAATYANQLLLLNSKNASAFASRYESNATIEWKALSGGCDGNYTGSKEISQLFGGLLNNTDSFLVSNETQRMGTEGNYWVVNSTFDFAGHGNGLKPFAGNFEAAIAAQDSYLHVGNAWLIASETWNFLHFDASFLNGPPRVAC